jgi:hypothetical protein
VQFEPDFNIEVKATMEVSSLTQCDLVQNVEGDDVVGMDPSNVEDTSTDKQNLEVGLCQRLSENPSPTEYHAIQCEFFLKNSFSILF